MKTQFIKIPEQFSRQLLKLPETGMGYQLVKVMLNSGRILDHLKVLRENDTIQSQDIVRLELESM